jgi:sterol 3beta-glucosyltransferase
VEALGVGTSVRKLTVENLAEAFIAATTDQRQIARAKLVGEQIRSVRAFYQAEGSTAE